MQIDDLVKYIEKNNDSNNIVIIGNGSGGKTYLAENLKKVYGLSENNILNSDDYLIDSHLRKKLQLTVYQEEAYFLPALDRDIFMATNGMTFKKIADYCGKIKDYIPSNINIFEGIGMAFTNIFNQSCLKIFIYTDPETEWNFRVSRDNIERRIPLEVVKNKFESRRNSFESEYEYLKTVCDIVIKNTKEDFFIDGK